MSEKVPRNKKGDDVDSYIDSRGRQPAVGLRLQTALRLMLRLAMMGVLAAAGLAACAVGPTPGLAQMRAMPANVAPPAKAPSPGFVNSFPSSSLGMQVSQLGFHFGNEPKFPADSGPDYSAHGVGAPSGFDGTGGGQGRVYTWQLLPDGLMYPAYLAGLRESRVGGQWGYETDAGWLMDATLGARVPLLRFGTDDPLFPEGWQIDAEGAAFPRIDWSTERDMIAMDFRFGVPITARFGRWEYKFAYYHLSAHLGDEFMVRYATFDRLNYVRDNLVLGAAVRPHPDLRCYAEVGWAFYTDGGADPWEFQFGADYSPVMPTGLAGSPFLAVNGHLRGEVDFGGHLSVQAGWQWRGETGHLLRAGLMYFNGQSIQYQFFPQHEQQIGFGAWYDF